MAVAKRVFLFLLTNLAVILTINLAFQLIQHLTGIQVNPSTYSGLIIFCSVWGMGGAFISLLISKWMAKQSMGVRLITAQSSNPEERELFHMVQSISKRAGLEKMPEVGIYDSEDANAFATGPSRNNSLVALSTGLIRRMNRDEVEGVIGHEIAHIANGDMVTMTLIQGIVNAFVMFFSRILARFIADNVNENMRTLVYFGLTLVFDMLFTVLGSLVVAYYSRAREFRADLGGARYTSREKMVSGLRRLQLMFDHLEPDNSNIAALKISSRPEGLRALFSTHPPLQERIRRLESSSSSSSPSSFRK
jgi:heat shock protein HtpX